MGFRWTAGAALLAAGMLIGAGGARAQEACAVPEDVPPLVYDLYRDLLDEGFPMAGPACEKLTKGALSACRKAVSAAARCWKGVGKGLAKGAKVTCKEQGDEEELCSVFTQEWLGGLQAEVAASEAEGHAACDAAAGGFLIDCLGF